MELTADQVIGFAIDQAARTGFYWNLYIGVVTAMFGILGSGKIQSDSGIFKVGLTVVFVVFAIGNWSSIENLGVVRRELLELLPSSYSGMAAGLSPRSFWGYVIYHSALDVLVISSIWVVRWPVPKKLNNRE
jgi:hypothetical protein